MDKALRQMNIQLDRAVSDIVGATGRLIIEAIIKGERNPLALAKFRDPRCRNSIQEIATYLDGVYNELHLTELNFAYQRYLFTLNQISSFDSAIMEILATPKEIVDLCKTGNQSLSDYKSFKDPLCGFCKVDLTKIEGIGPETALTILSEFGTDLSRFPTEKHFCSYLGLSPACDISGGRVLSHKTKKATNRVATVLRLAANSLRRSKSWLGQKFRGLLIRKGAAKAITAMAHKLARIVYALWLMNLPSKIKMGFLPRCHK